MINDIHSTAIIGDNVSLGKGNKILPYTVLTGPLDVGDNNIIGPHVVIGTPGEDTRNPYYDSSDSKIKIGSNNIIREFTAVQKPIDRDITCLENDIHLMHGVHIPHDAILENGVVLTPLVVIGGISRIMEYANIGMGATVHQYSIVGPYSIIATGAASIKNVKPFSRYIPGKPISVNSYAVKKFNFTEYTDEITKYVLEGICPKSDKVGSIIEKYLKLHADSGRRQY